MYITVPVLIILLTWALAFSESEQPRRIERYLWRYLLSCMSGAWSTAVVQWQYLAGHPKGDAVFPIPVSPIQAFVDLVVLLVDLLVDHMLWRPSVEVCMYGCDPYMVPDRRDRYVHIIEYLEYIVLLPAQL